MAGRGACGSGDVRRVRILLDGYDGSTGVQMARIVARALDDLKVLLILRNGWEGCTWVR